jgi:hypothetical protein
MTDAKYHTPEAGALEGRVFCPTTPAELAEAVDLAFDYRGDVTLQLQSGAMIEGYLFNRNPSGSRPFLQLFPKGESGVREVPYAEVVTIAFTGNDTASGKSWEAWVAKKVSQRRAESEEAAAAAKARGHL